MNEELKSVLEEMRTCIDTFEFLLCKRAPERLYLWLPDYQELSAKIEKLVVQLKAPECDNG